MGSQNSYWKKQIDKINPTTIKNHSSEKTNISDDNISQKIQKSIVRFP